MHDDGKDEDPIDLASLAFLASFQRKTARPEFVLSRSLDSRVLLQREYLKRTYAVPDGDLLERMARSYIESARPQLELDSPELSSHLNYLASAVREQFRTAASFAKFPTNPGKIIIASHPSGQLNAMSLKLPTVDNTYAILVETHIMLMVHECVKIVCEILPAEDQIDWEAPIDVGTTKSIILNNARTEHYHRLGSLLLSLIYHGDIRTAGPRPVVGPNLDLLDQIRNSIESFILAHEIAHIYAGDLDSGDIFSESKIDATGESWAREWYSDLLGFRFASGAAIDAGWCDFSVCFASIELYWRLQWLFALCVSTAGGRRLHHGGTHPLAPHRLSKLRTNVRSVLLNDLDKWRVEDAIALSRTFGFALELLIVPLVDFLRDLNARGTRPWIGWRLD